jgi:surface protein
MRGAILILLATAVAAAGCDNQLPTGPTAPAPEYQIAPGSLWAVTPSTIITRDMCVAGGWQELGFKNQGQCVSYVQTGKARMGFETTWDTRLMPGTPFVPRTMIGFGLDGEVDATIYWGDGTFSRVDRPGIHTHEYLEEGVYTVSITGKVTTFRNRGDYWLPPDVEPIRPHYFLRKLVSVDSWGDLGFTSMYYGFNDAVNLVSVPRTSAGLEGVTTMAGMFFGTSSFNADISRWDVSNVINMLCMFQLSAFNQDIGRWDVSNVTTMTSMLSFTPFNQGIGDWDVSNVTNMMSMFWGATEFDQDIGGWDVSNVVTMFNMFGEATSFNQDIGGWDVSNVIHMNRMFWDATAFNQDLSGWCVEQIQERPGGFDEGATSWLNPAWRPAWGTCP